ncbi:hypothetical protein P3H15_32790 [Rhodococcus sp. T2V]|nr:hypothetical protein [Rhodococcus sp. T2V]
MHVNALLKSDPIKSANEFRAEIEEGKRDWVTGLAICIIFGLVLAVVIYGSAVSA